MKTAIYFRRIRQAVAFNKARIARLNLMGERKEKQKAAEQLRKDLGELKAAREFLR